MKFSVKNDALAELAGDVLVVSLASDGSFSPLLQILNKTADNFFQKQNDKGNLPEKNGTWRMFVDVPNVVAKRVVILRCPEDHNGFKNAVAKIQKLIKDAGWEKIILALTDSIEGIKTVARTVVTEAYFFDTFKSQKIQSKEYEWIFAVKQDEYQETEAALELILAWAHGIYLTRDLANMPPNVCTPAYLGKTAQELATCYETLTVKVLEKKAIEDLGMGALLGVAQGSANAPRFIIFEYKHPQAQNEKPTVLVGKGVTFDSGGISLKPGAAMDEMKYDMGGAAAVFGALKALCEAQLPLYVVGLIAAVENMPDGNATRPGDILTSLSGKTIEVLNTDAEGRLILCDALTYAERYQPQAVIDMATLTGACIIALGNIRSGLISNDDKLADALFRAGESADDLAWRLPLDQAYKDMLKSPFADLPNISGGREAGTITAGAFLSAFTENYPWAHLDIAGTAWKSGAQKGATGRPVGLLLEYFCAQVV